MRACRLCELGIPTVTKYEVYHRSGSWAESIFNVTAGSELYQLMVHLLGGVAEHYVWGDETFEHGTVVFMRGIRSFSIQVGKPKTRSSDGNEKTENRQPINVLSGQQGDQGRCKRGAIFNDYQPLFSPLSRFQTALG